MNEAIQYNDFSVVCGYRTKKDQNRAYKDGFSQLRFPKSKHNKKPSLAVDIIPYPSGYTDLKEFFTLATVIKKVAEKHKINLFWGGDFQTFEDLPHWELRRKK